MSERVVLAVVGIGSAVTLAKFGAPAILAVIAWAAAFVGVALVLERIVRR